MRRSWKLGLFAAVTLIALMAVLEIGARIALSQDVVLTRLMRSYDESTWRLNWVNRHRTGIEVLYGFDRYDPSKGWSTYANVRDLAVFDGKTLNTNRYGHRGSLDLTRAKRPGWRRIIVLGDSYTFGDEVSDDETYSHLLGRALEAQRIEVVNLGVHGYGHDQMLILLQEQGAKLEPDLVLLGFIYDDIIRNGLAFRDYAKPTFEWGGTALQLRNSPVTTPFEQAGRERWRSKLLDLGMIFWRRVDNALGWRSERDRTRARQILDEIAATSERLGAKALFVYLPEASELAMPKLARKHERFLLDHCEANGSLDCGSVLPAFQERIARGERFRVGWHWARNGHEAVADGVMQLLRERRWVD